MSELDVVAELHHWTNQGVGPPLQVIRRACDEIVALRKQVAEQDHRSTPRNAALEEAARVVESPPGGIWMSADCAAAIRALKRKPIPDG